MLDSLLQGLAFGMVLQLSVGPVCLGVFQKAVNDRIRLALAMVAGVVGADALYIALAAAGVSALLTLDVVRLPIAIVGGLALVAFGVRGVATASAPSRVEVIQAPGVGQSLRYGFALTLTNPLTIVFWGSVFAGLVGGLGIAGVRLATFSLGCVAATALFLSGVALAGRAAAPWLGSGSRLVWLNRVVSLCLIGFGVALVVRAVGSS